MTEPVPQPTLAPTSEPPPPPAAAGRWLDRLAVAHYIVAGLTACLALPGVSTLRVGLLLIDSVDGPLPEVFLQAESILKPILGPLDELHNAENRALLGGAAVMAGTLLIFLGLIHAAVLVYIGRCLARRKRWTLCFIFSLFDLTYLLPPLGTVLSLFAIPILLRPSVRAAFKAEKAAAAFMKARG